MDVPMELSRILITQFSDQQVIQLREKGGDRTFPIAIGVAEALAIDRRLKGIEVPRPMTHDLLANVIDALGGQLERITINDLRKLGPEDAFGTFIATLHIRRDSEVVEIDSRPSDAIALGVAMETPIFVAQHVLEQATKPPVSRADRIQLLRNRMEALEDRMEKLSERLANDKFLADAPPEAIDQHRRLLTEMKSEYEAIAEALRKHG